GTLIFLTRLHTILKSWCKCRRFFNTSFTKTEKKLKNILLEIINYHTNRYNHQPGLKTLKNISKQRIYQQNKCVKTPKMIKNSKNLTEIIKINTSQKTRKTPSMLGIV
ncbi:MAG: hypothetical protein NTV75_00390, partial [Bacteroidia bacterium]|nr:hypothetical protein [Bacteroidia bacterium]